MRILEINKFYYRKGGADKHFLDVIALLEKAGHEVAVFSMHSRHNGESPWKEYFLSEVGYTEEYSFSQKLKGIARMFYSSEAQRKIRKLLDAFQPDIVHIHNIYHQLSPGILFEIKKRGIPVVMTIHDYKLVNPNYSLYLDGKFYDRCREGRFFECVADRCVRGSYFASLIAALETWWHEKRETYRKNIDHYLVPSIFAKKILVERGMEAAKISVFPHFILDSENENNDNNATAIIPNKEVKKPYALYPGRISKEKGVDTLIRIFRNLQGIELHLAGRTESGFAVPETGNVRMLGFLTPKELGEKVSGASLVVSGSRLSETFGLVALEAIAEGKPFVGFRTGAYPEIIQDGVNGYLVEDEKEFAERLIQIVNEYPLDPPERIREKARERFGAEKYLRRLEEIFRQVSGKK